MSGFRGSFRLDIAPPNRRCLGSYLGPSGQESWELSGSCLMLVTVQKYTRIRVIICESRCCGPSIRNSGHDTDLRIENKGDGWRRFRCRDMEGEGPVRAILYGIYDPKAGRKVDSSSPSWGQSGCQVRAARKAFLSGCKVRAVWLQSASRLGSYKRQILGALGSPDRCKVRAVCGAINGRF